MKVLRITLILIIVLLGFTNTNEVQAARFVYTSGFQVQNLANLEATITLSFYNTSDGLLASQATSTIPALGSSNFFPINAPDGFKGSVVISSDQPLASITNLIASDSTGRVAVASYIGFTSGSDEVFLPLLHYNNNNWYTWFSVQNIGSLDANVTVSYSDGTTATFNGIRPGASHVFDQFTETHTQKVLSAKVNSNQALAITVLEENATTKAILAYNGFSTSDTNVLIPLVNANNNSYQTGIQLQNNGAMTSTITLTYYPAVGTQCAETHVIESGKSATFAYNSFRGLPLEAGASTTCNPGQTFVGSAKVTQNSANVNLNAIINQVNTTNGYGSAYSSFITGNLTNKVVFPLIMDRNNGWYTGFNLMNAGDQVVTVNCVFTNTSYTVSGTLGPGEALNAVQNGKVAIGYVGSGSCTASGTGTNLISGVVNEIGTTGVDRMMTYEGLNANP